MRQGLYIRVLEQTATTLGGPDALAVFLDVAPCTVERWLAGSAPVPLGAFLTCVDHLIDWEFAHVRDLLFDETHSAASRPVRAGGSPEAVMRDRKGWLPE